MKRRVIKQGHNTLTITIPSKWGKKYNIQSGDEIELDEKESSLVINAKQTQDVRAITLDLRDVPIPFLWRTLISAYRAGYDEITIRFQNPKITGKNVYTGFGYNNLQWLFYKGIVDLSPIEAIQALVNRLIGIEIIDQKENFCIIKEMGETTYKEFDNALRRIFLLLLSMADECYDGYANNHKDPLRSVHLIDTNIDRFEDFCLRVLNKMGYKEYKKTPTMYAMIFLLEMVGDEYKKLALHCLEQKGKPHNLIIKEFEIQKQQLRRFYELFYSYSKEKICEIYTADQEGDDYLKDTYAKYDNIEKEIIHHCKKIGIYMLSLTELRIDLEA
jgi:phosphate uptake regulator